MNSTPGAAERLAHHPLPEMRVFLIEIPENPSLESLKEQIRMAGESGFNAIQIPFVMNGFSLFSSRVARHHKIPVIRPDLKKKGDLYYPLFEAAANRDLPVLAYVNPLLVGDDRVHPAGPVLRRHMKWGVMNKEKKFAPAGVSPHDLFLCVNNPDVRRFVAELLVEIVESFPLSGLVLDMCLYPYQYNAPEQAACFCDFCRKSVKDELKMDLLTIPLEINNVAFRRWKKWREERLVSFLSYVSMRIRKSRINVAVFIVIPGGLDTMNTSSLFNQDTLQTLTSDCSITSVITRYSPDSPRQIAKMAERDLAVISDDGLLLPLISAENERHLTDCLLHLRPLPLFGSFVSLPAPLPGNLHEALFRIPFTPSSLHSRADIFRSVRDLIKYILCSSDLQLALNSFLRDVIHYLDEEPSITVERILDMVEDFRIMEQKFQTGDLDTTFLPPETLRHISLIKKLLRTSTMLLR